MGNKKDDSGDAERSWDETVSDAEQKRIEETEGRINDQNKEGNG